MLQHIEPISHSRHFHIIARKLEIWNCPLWDCLAGCIPNAASICDLLVIFFVDIAYTKVLDGLYPTVHCPAEYLLRLDGL